MCAQVQAPCDSVGPADAKRLTQQHVYFLAALLIYACVTHLISRELLLARLAVRALLVGAPAALSPNTAAGWQ